MPQPQTRLNPLTALAVGASGWILALGLGMGVSCIALSLRYGVPVVTARRTNR